MNSLRFFNPYEEIRFTENLLPHWHQDGATYFVTFRLVDSVPANLRIQWEEERATWSRFHPEPWDSETEQEYHKRFTDAIERWLDAGTVRVLCVELNARRQWMRRCTISMVNGWRLSRRL